MGVVLPGVQGLEFDAGPGEAGGAAAGVPGAAAVGAAVPAAANAMSQRGLVMVDGDDPWGWPDLG